MMIYLAELAYSSCQPRRAAPAAGLISDKSFSESPRGYKQTEVLSYLATTRFINKSLWNLILCLQVEPNLVVPKKQRMIDSLYRVAGAIIVNTDWK